MFGAPKKKIEISHGAEAQTVKKKNRQRSVRSGKGQSGKRRFNLLRKFSSGSKERCPRLAATISRRTFADREEPVVRTSFSEQWIRKQQSLPGSRLTSELISRREPAVRPQPYMWSPWKNQAGVTTKEAWAKLPNLLDYPKKSPLKSDEAERHSREGYAGHR